MSKRSLLTEWDTYLERFPRHIRDIYFTERYVRLYEGADSQAQAFLFEDSGETFLLPHLTRPVSLLGRGLADFETAYGYGGPLSTTEDQDFVSAACAAVEELAADSGLIGGFIRFHPLVGNASWVAHCWPVVFDRTTVAVDLTLTEEEMIQSMHRSYRNRLRKAEATGLTFLVDSSYQRMAEFESLYNTTMQRLEAAPEYFFSSDYFAAIRRGFVGDGFLGLVMHGTTLASAGLFLHMGDYGHAHLAASDTDYLSEGANNLLFVGGALAMQALGARVMHLGGGRTSSPDDSLLRFKQNYATVASAFYRAQVVTRPDDYAEACAAWDAGPGRSEKMAPYRSFFLRFHYRESDEPGSGDAPATGTKQPHVVLIGGGGHARSLLDILLGDGGLVIMGLLEIDAEQVGREVEGIPVLGDDRLLVEMTRLGGTHFIVALGGIGDNEPRRRLYVAGCAAGLSPLTVFHRSAVISPRATIGLGCQLMAGCIVNAGASVGDNVLINTGAIVEHDCLIEDHVHVASGATLAGGVTVGALAHIGAGAVVRQNISIGARALVGAGAVVVSDVAEGAVVVGVPARPLPGVQSNACGG